IHSHGHSQTLELASTITVTHKGHGPRLSKVNLFTLLSLWMELFPQEPPEDEDQCQQHDARLIFVCGVLQVRGTGLVVVRDNKVVGLHCSGPELHAGQAAIIRHGARLVDCQLYFSRRPCATCLKMIINGEERGRVGTESWAERDWQTDTKMWLDKRIDRTLCPSIYADTHETTHPAVQEQTL
uniref:CMP/dCMP-type deaminase domain-containing protein n=1 Tax=Myripristis murdjan TaxID=586833 RepID=A0A667XKY1_9TELE